MVTSGDDPKAKGHGPANARGGASQEARAAWILLIMIVVIGGLIYTRWIFPVLALLVVGGGLGCVYALILDLVRAIEEDGHLPGDLP